MGAVVACLVMAGCGRSASERPPRFGGEPISVGPGPAYRPPPLSRPVAAGRPIGRLRCRPRPDGPRFLTHIEIFARRRVVAIPAGVGVAPPLRREGAYVHGGRCVYPVRTREPTGLVEVAASRHLRLGDLFAIWGQPLSATRLAGFTAPAHQPVVAFVAGQRWRGDPRAIPLTRHAVIALEADGFVTPHRSYRFPPPH